MKKLFLIVAIFGSLFFTSCDPEPLSEELELQFTEGEDGQVEGEEEEEEQENG